MHAESLTAMDTLLNRLTPVYTNNYAAVLDVGSLDINGTYREIVQRRGWSYIGTDIVAGPNVDVVADDLSGFKPGYDVVLCGNMLHNVERPWLLIPAMARLLRPGGLLAVVASWRHGLNSYPADYWRFSPDGLRILFDEAGCLDQYQIDFAGAQDVQGSALRR